MIISPSNPKQMLLGGIEIDASRDGGKTWTTINPGDGGETYIMAIAQSTRNPKVIYAGTQNGEVLGTADFGNTWYSLSLPGVDSATGVTHIVISPRNDHLIYITSGGYAYPHSNHHVYMVDTESSTKPVIKDLTGNLPDSPVNAEALIGNRLFVGTADAGVYVSEAGSNRWTRFGVGLPNSSVVDLVHTGDGNLLAATHGRGMFEIQLGGAAS